MKISIITVCFNSEKYIARTIESILTQNFNDFEYLIIDGESKDNTLNIIETYKPSFAEKGISFKIISEKDKGIYDAMNKGILNASGDIIGILNSDDYYASDDILETVYEAINENNVDSCFGDLVYIKDGEKYRYWKSGRLRTFKLGWMPPHPSLFIKKAVYEKYGLFRLDCGTSADYELLTRLFQINKVSSIWVNKIFTFMEAGGASGANLTARMKALKYDKFALNVNGIHGSIFVIILKKLRKLPQFLLK